MMEQGSYRESLSLLKEASMVGSQFRSFLGVPARALVRGRAMVAKLGTNFL